MIRTLVTILALLQLIVCGVEAQTAQEIVRRSEDLLKGKTSRGSFRMTIETPDFTRSMDMDSWWVGNDKALITITAPQREAGNKTLKVKNELWMYLRNTETTIKVPPSMMLQSWNGSDFTNDDLVRESSLADDYTMTLAGTETLEGAASWKLELHPKPNAPVVWGRIVTWVRKDGFIPLRAEYYDERGVRIRTMVYSNIRSSGGRTIPTTWTMVNEQKPGNRTTFQILSITFDLHISDRIFSFQELEKGRSR